MDSCLVFIYNKNSESFLNHIIKLFIPQKLKINKLNDSLNSFSFLINSFTEEDSKIDILKSTNVELNNNTYVIKSEICGLGKTTKIKKYIKEKNKKYFYFPISGTMTKNSLYQKLQAILFKIKTIEDYNDIAIHLDLFENNETSIINEFLFSLLITKFY